MRSSTRLRSAADWLVMSDPGWGRAQLGWRTLVSLVAGMAAGYGVARGLGEPYMVGLLFGGLLGLISGMQVADGPVRGVVTDVGWFAPPFAVGLLLSVAMAPHRTPGLSLLVVAIFLTGYLDRFGHRGHYCGTMFFVAYSTGLLVRVPLSSYPRCLAIIAAAVAASVLVRVVLCRYDPARDLRQTLRAWQVACRRAAASMQQVVQVDLAEPERAERAARRLRRDLERVNTMALIIDGRLAHPSLDGKLAEHLHRHVFDVEQALVSLAALFQTLTEEPALAALSAVAVQLDAMAAGQPGEPAALRACAAELRAAGQVSQQRSGELLELAADELHAYQRGTDILSGELTVAAAEHLPFEGVVALEGAQPAGVRPLSRKAAAAAPAILRWRVRRPSPTTVIGIQVGIATAIALPIGYAFDSQHYYWAVIGVMIMGGGVSTPHERGRKVLRRIVGTVVGAVLGVAIHDLVGVGHTWWTLTVIVIALTLGAYLSKVSYAYFAVGLVIALTQTYALTTSGGNLDIVLVHRLTENVIGGVVTLFVTLVVLPVHTSSVIRAGLRSTLHALNHCLASLSTQLNDPDASVRLRSDTRALDHALFQTRQVSAHLVRAPAHLASPAVTGSPAEHGRELMTRWGGRHERLDDVIDGLAAATYQIHAIARHAPHRYSPESAVTAAVTRILDTLTTSISALDGRVGGLPDQKWISCRPLIHQLLAQLPAEDAGLAPTLKGLEELDSRLTLVATNLGLIIANPQTVPLNAIIGSPLEGIAT